MNGGAGGGESEGRGQGRSQGREQDRGQGPGIRGIRQGQGTGIRVRPLGADDPEAIGPYRLLGRLGSGGMGRVHVARSPGGRLVAVKTLLAEGVVSESDRRRFAREVRLARRVGGVCTANVVDADPDAERPWLATEFIPAPALDDLVRGCGPLPPDAVPWVAAGAAEALVALHEAGVVHRDVKPGNILLPPDGPRLIDFGISHAVDITRTTLTLGTIAYTSPEQARGEETTAGSDVFSLGATLFHLATGRPPYRDTGDTLRLLAQVSRGDRDLSGLPPELGPLVMRCLHDTPDRRPTPSQLLDELAPLVAAGPTSAGEGHWLPPKWLRLIESYEAEGRALLDGRARLEGHRPSGPDPRRAFSRGEGDGSAAPGGSGVEDARASEDVLGPDATPTQDLRTRPVPEPNPTRPYTQVRPAGSSASAGSSVRSGASRSEAGASSAGAGASSAKAGDSRSGAGASSAKAGDSRSGAGASSSVSGSSTAGARTGSSASGASTAGPGAGSSASGASTAKSGAARARAGARARQRTRSWAEANPGAGRDGGRVRSSGRVRSAPAPAPAAPKPAPPAKKSSGGWLMAVFIVLLVVWFANLSSQDDDSSGAGSYPTTAPITPTPLNSPSPDPTEEAFAAVRAGDCLNAYGTGYLGQWSTEVPERVDCDAADAFVRVTSTEGSAVDCPDSTGRSYWSYYGRTAGYQVLCLERQFRVGQCVPAEAADNGGVRANLLRVWNCGADTVPAGHKYILQITNIYKGSDGQCPVSTRYWTWSVYGGKAYLCMVTV
ncbi:serine/threonine protein kinase [Streptomyces ipomoeae]|uniref:serine/threonine protein kinase n=1 Tax=Streptomyces ipomoeae TaxID=103232 RepID=UPI0015F026B3|nr:serine/threonine-protein kinase [Streptomyces ipomoeae]MDX2931140.1 protein kinase [Streptomyces ipomoeae]